MKANSSYVRLASGLIVPQSDYIDAQERQGIPRRVTIAGLIQAVLVNDSIPFTPGTGGTMGAHTLASKKHEGIVRVDEFGHIIGSRDTYFYNIPSQVHVNTANTVHWDLFNADATLLVRVQSIRQIPNIVTVVTGIAFAWLLERTTSVGTGGTAQTAWLPDTSQTALDVDITCRTKPTGGAVQSTDLFNYAIHSEESNPGTIALAAQGGLELVPKTLSGESDREHGILLRPAQGLCCVQVTSSVQGNTGWLIAFTVEAP